MLIDRHHDGVGHLVHLGDGLGDGFDGRDRFVGAVLHIGDLFRDFLGGLAGLAGQMFDLVGDDGKALARFTGSCRLDGGVQGQQIGLAGDVIDQIDHVADTSRRIHQAPDQIVGLFRFQGSIFGNFIGVIDVSGDFPAGSRQFFRRRRHGFHIGRGLLHGIGHCRDIFNRLFRHLHQIAGG